MFYVLCILIYVKKKIDVMNYNSKIPTYFESGA